MMVEQYVMKLLVTMVMCCWGITISMAEVDDDYLMETPNSAGAAQWLPQSLENTFMDDPLSHDQYKLQATDIERSALSNDNRQMAAPSKRADSRRETVQNRDTKRFTFWKRLAPFRESNSRFWKRRNGHGNLDAFWKRSGRPTLGWLRYQSNANNNNNVAFWKRSGTDQYWNKRGEREIPFEINQDSSLDGSEQLQTSRRSSMPLSLMMFPRYRPASTFPLTARRQWLVEAINNEQPPSKDKQSLNLPIPSKNRRQGPKLNPDFNPTGW